MGWRPAQQLFKQWRIYRGDTVLLLAGRDKGQKGTVRRVIRDRNAVIVEGKNLVKKHVKKTEQQAGGIVTVESPIHVSNVSLLDPTTGAPCRVTFRWLEDGSKVRVATGSRSSGSVIPTPAILKERRPRPENDGPKATAANDATELTWNPITREGGLPSLIQKNGHWQVDLRAI